MLKCSPVYRSAARSWISTLKLPRSDFPARPEPDLRQQLTQSCTDNLYAWQNGARSAGRTFTLHDGPPYANGDLHIGHALNKILKDIFNRFQLSQGKQIRYLPGWDCHGLPIEVKALQKLGQRQDGTTVAPAEIRRAAADLASSTVETQKDGFRSWGVMGDWDHAYRTMAPDFETKQLEVFQQLVQRGLIYRQHKPVYWSPSSGTALAEAELEYDDSHVSPAAFVKFRLSQLPSVLESLELSTPVHALVWTTTPWTLPANQAIAVHPELEYCVVRHGHEHLLVAASRLDHVAKPVNVGGDGLEVVKAGIRGKDLSDRCQYHNGFQGVNGSPRPILSATYVSAETGTGLVHTAPGHGHDDYDLGRAHGLDTVAPVDELGRFTDKAMPDSPEVLKGKPVLREGNKAVLDLLRSGDIPHASPSLLHAHKYKHRYPIDWRTKLPVIIRATAQWFADVETVKDSALQAISEVTFIPDSGKSRLTNFVLGRSQWCISRQRAWGVPIPVLYKVSGGQTEAVMTTESILHIISVIKQRGIDAWWTDSADDPAWVPPALTPDSYIRGKDTMDVWFDSGTTWTQLDGQLNPDGFLADVYLEGSDQHRGWFQSSLLTKISSDGHNGPKGMKAPYQRLITHGFILDDKGRKMSKSIGNVVGPDEIMNGTLLPPLKRKGKQKSQQSTQPQHDAMGPDALRLWVAKNDYTNDVPVGEKILQGVNAALHKYRVTLKWLLGVLDDYDPAQAHKAAQLASKLDLSDRLALLHLTETETRVHAAYSNYEPYKAMRELERYVNVDLSSFYFETAKDVIYTSTREDRLTAQLVCFDIFQGLLIMLAPATPLLVAETLHYASPGLLRLLQGQEKEPFKRIWQPTDLYSHVGHFNVSLATQSDYVAGLRAAVNAAQEQLRTAKRIGSSLESCVHIQPLGFTASESPATKFFEKATATSELSRALVVSEVVLDSQQSHALDDETASRVFSISDATGEHSFIALVSRIDAAKCPRCWRFAIPRTKIKQSEYDCGEQTCDRCSAALQEEDHLLPQP